MKTLSKQEIRLLRILEEDSSLSIEEMSNRLSISKKEVEVLKQGLEDEGILLKYRAVINWEKIESQGVVAIIQVSVTPAKGFGYDEVAKIISNFSEVKTCLLVSGAFDLLVEVEGPSLREVAFFVADKLATIEGVENTRTNFLLKRYKQAGDILVSGKTHRLSLFV